MQVGAGGALLQAAGGLLRLAAGAASHSTTGVAALAAAGGRAGAGAGRGAAQRAAVSSSAAPHDQQQQQQQPDQQQQGQRGTQQGEQQGPYKQPGVQEQAQEVSKAMLVKSFDTEELWLSAVGGIIKTWSVRAHPELKGKDAEIVGRVREAYDGAFARAAAGRLLTPRMRSQLKQACLAAATHKVLLDAVPGDAAAVEQHIGDCMGGLYAPFLLGGLKVTTWVRRVLLRQSSISQAVDTLHTIAKDMEGACHCSVQPLCARSSDSEAEDNAQVHAPDAGSAAAQAQPAPGAGSPQQEHEQRQAQEQEDEEREAAAAAEAAQQHHAAAEWQSGAALTVDRCMFAEVLAAEGALQLLRFFCCQHNMAWLDAYRAQGVDAHLEACIARGDSCCRMTVVPVDGGA